MVIGAASLAGEKERWDGACVRKSNHTGPPPAEKRKATELLLKLVHNSQSFPKLSKAKTLAF